MKPRSLPETLSGLLTSAINDARQLDRSRYLPSARQWHVHQENQCQVCLSGAVMAASLEADPLIELVPSDFPHNAMHKLYALNRIRCGNWIDAWVFLHGSPPSLLIRNRLSDLPSPRFSHFDGWDQFDAHLLSLELFVPQLRSIEQLDDSL